MFDLVSTSLFGTADSAMASVSTPEFLMCCAASIVLGAACAAIYMFRHNCSKNFVVTLALLPLVVQMVITLVNGNLGAGIAVMGVFNLVRFRSIPGSAKDIGSVFLAMAIGLATGMGFIGLAMLFTIIVAVECRVCARRLASPPSRANACAYRCPKISNSMACSIACWGVSQKAMSLLKFARRTWAALYQLEYEIRMRKPGLEKRMIDEMRTMNGNLKITLGRAPMAKEVL